MKSSKDAHSYCCPIVMTLRLSTSWQFWNKEFNSVTTQSVLESQKSANFLVFGFSIKQYYHIMHHFFIFFSALCSSDRLFLHN